MSNCSADPRSLEFDAFLYSIIVEEECGASLTVLSLLARQDVDPWEEAATYARLPREAAVSKLSDLLVKNIADPSTEDGLHAYAVRLLERLPQPAPADAVSRERIRLVLESLVEVIKTASRVWIRNDRR